MTDAVGSTVDEIAAPVLAPAELVRCAALFAGLGRRAEAITREILAAMSAGEDLPGDELTCFDAGSRLVLSVIAPGGRGLRATVRSQATSTEGGSAWIRIHEAPQGLSSRWRGALFAREGIAAFRAAEAAALHVGAESAFRRCHAALGPRGRIHSVERRTDAGAGALPQATIGWVLEATSSPIQALDACGVEDGWARAAPLLRELFGYPPSPRAGPWSVLCTFGGGEPRVHLGTTAWARVLDDAPKRRRLAALASRLGGDGGFAEGLYKLVSSAHPNASGARIGRAVEVELSTRDAPTVELYLCAR